VFPLMGMPKSAASVVVRQTDPTAPSASREVRKVSAVCMKPGAPERIARIAASRALAVVRNKETSASDPKGAEPVRGLPLGLPLGWGLE